MSRILSLLLNADHEVPFKASLSSKALQAVAVFVALSATHFIVWLIFWSQGHQQARELYIQWAATWPSQVLGDILTRTECTLLTATVLFELVGSGTPIGAMQPETENLLYSLMRTSENPSMTALGYISSAGDTVTNQSGTTQIIRTEESHTHFGVYRSSLQTFDLEPLLRLTFQTIHGEEVGVSSVQTSVPVPLNRSWTLETGTSTPTPNPNSACRSCNYLLEYDARFSLLYQSAIKADRQTPASQRCLSPFISKVPLTLLLPTLWFVSITVGPNPNP